MSVKIVSSILLVALMMLGCSAKQPSRNEPIHLHQNMDDQPRINPQAESGFYADGLGMRLPVEGTVARGWLRTDSLNYYTGFEQNGRPVETNPLPITMELMERGRERYEIFCTPCHGQIGTGQGIVVKKGMLMPPSFHEDRLVDTADGHFYDVITNGIRNMPAYRVQIPVEDRWAIVAYVRALQRSRQGTIDDIPPGQMSAVRQ